MSRERQTAPTPAPAAERGADTHAGTRAAMVEPVLEPPLTEPPSPRAVGDFVHVPANAAPRLAPPDDPAERDADGVAAQVLQGRTSVPGRYRPSNGGDPVTESILERLRSRRGHGTGLDPALRSRLEPLLGGRLDGVRVHDDAAAHELARDLGARALNLDRDLYFARGQFAPARPDGLRLLSHELAHALQARGVASPPLRLQPQPGSTAPPKVAHVVRIVVYVDLEVVTLRLDDGTSVTGQLTYNGRPNPGTYRVVWDGTSYKHDTAEYKALGGVVDKDGRMFVWVPEREVAAELGRTVAIDVIGGRGGGTGEGVGGAAPPAKPPPKTTSDAAGDKPTAPKGEGTKKGGEKREPPNSGKDPAAKGQTGTSVPGPTVTDPEYAAKLRALPPEIKAILGGESSFEPGDYDQLLAIAEKLRRLTPSELEIYRSLAGVFTNDLRALEESIDLFFAIKADIKAQIDAQVAAKAKEPTLEEKLEKTWQGFDTAKFAGLSADEKERTARAIAAEQRNIQLEHMLTHPGELVVGMAEGIIRPDKMASAIADDVKEAFDGTKNGFARSAAAVGATGKTAGWLAGIASALFVVMLFVPGANLVQLATVVLIATGIAFVAAVAEAELRIEAARRAPDPAEFQRNVEKSAAAQANAIVQAAMLALHVTAKLVARIPLGAKYQNVGTALRMARSSLIRVTGVGEAFDRVRSALLTRLRAARGGLPEALAAETQTVSATAAQIKGMTGTSMLERIAAGDKALADGTGITPEIAKSALETAKLTGSSAVPDQVRQNVLRALDDAPQQASRQVEQFNDGLDKTVAAVEKADTPAELRAALDSAEGRTSAEAVAAREQAATESYVRERLKADLATAKKGTPAAPPAEPAKAPQPAKPPGPSEEAKPRPAPKTRKRAKPAEEPKPAEAPKPTEEAKPSVEAKPEEPRPPAKPAEPDPATRDFDLAAEEKLLKEAEAAKAAKAAAEKQPQPGTSAEPKPGVAAEAAKQRLGTAQAELDLLNSQRKLVNERHRILVEESGREAKLKQELLDQHSKAKDPALKRDLLDKARAAEARRAKAVADANDLFDERNSLGRDIAAKENAVRRIEIDVDPKRHRAGLPCFAGDTPVWTQDGPRRIDRLRPGDGVLSFDFAAGRVECRSVRQVVENRARHFYELRAGGETICATGRHRFWVEGSQRWMPVAEVEPGMVLRRPDGGRLTVAHVALRDGGDRPSWNLAIDVTPNFFVGPGVLVHNAGGFDTGLGGRISIYLATNPKHPGKVYVGQSVDIDIREGGHQRFARKKLANRGVLSARDIEFFEFMSEADLEPIVRGLNKDQADFLEQRNLDLEAELRGEQNVINRRAQIRSDDHMRKVTERIENDEAVIKAGYCRK